MKFKLFDCQGSTSQGAPKSVVILEPSEIPTTSFYVRSRIPRDLPSRRFDSIAAPPQDLLLEEGTWVLIVRHASRKWLRTLLKNKGKLLKVSYLKDDDIPAALAARELPLHYAIWTIWRYLTTRDLLSRVVSEIIVSTQELADRYPLTKPAVWEPHYDDTSEYRDAPLVYFYHATLTHAREMKWLVPIVRRVQKAVPNAWFEIIGDGSVARMYSGIPRVRVVHPMKWPNYQAYIGSIRYEVGLAPLHDTSFNRARSHTKLYQITRAGAAGIYSDVIPYSGKIVDGVTGVLCANHRYLWVRAIVALLRESARRVALHENARIWCDELQNGGHVPEVISEGRLKAEEPSDGRGVLGITEGDVYA